MVDKDASEIFLVILLTALWAFFGAGTITLLRKTHGIPKIAALLWPLLLLVAAGGGFDEDH